MNKYINNETDWEKTEEKQSEKACALLVLKSQF